MASKSRRRFSFSSLRDIPADTIKIDQSFIRRLVPGSRGSALVRNMITMARELGFRVVAEGVETKEVYDFLCDTPCTAVQGYLISRPLPPDELRAWLGSWKPLRRARRVANRIAIAIRESNFAPTHFFCARGCVFNVAHRCVERQHQLTVL